jgi:chemotaxis protein CheX
MDVKIVNSFLTAVQNVLQEFDIKDVKKGKLTVKKEMSLDKDITTFIGVVGEMRGSVSYSFDTNTACKLASSMLMGMPVDKIDEMARSAISELANMFTGNAIAVLNTDNKFIDITPPTLVMGEDIYFVIGTVDTLMVNIDTNIGTIEVNFGFET